MAYYYRHPDLVLPDDNSIIWRYMDYSKFQSIFKERSIFFSRADKQTDSFEGEYPNGMLDELEKRKEKIGSDDGTSYTFAQWHTQKEIRSRLLSCWSVGLNETRRMWLEYTDTKESVAIRSTIERLKNCFHSENEEKVYIGIIRYGDEENRLPKSKFKWKVDYLLYPFFAKKEEFRWENEVRATVNIALRKQLRLKCSSNGCFIKADLYVLIDSVWVHPLATEDFRQKVGSLLIDYGHSKISIYQSIWESLPE